MTGYATASAELPRGTLALELRSVNSRYLDIQFRIADELRAAEPALRELIGSRLARGKIDCRIALDARTGSQSAQPLNPDAVENLRRLAADAQRAFPDAAPLRLADVLRWPGVIAEAPQDEGELRAAALAGARAALEELCGTRAREGAKLAQAIVARVGEMELRVAELAPLVPEAVAAFQAKLAQRLHEALGSADDERVRAELAVFGMKSDVEEEMTRLVAHLGEVRRALAQGGPVGKRLDFLAQELNREANTIASKAAGPRISDIALELKLLVEQMREQVQNIE